MARIERPLTLWASKTRGPNAPLSLHRDIYVAALLLLEEGHKREDIFGFLREGANKVTERVVPDREIVGALDCAESWIAGGGVRTAPSWPATNNVYRNEVIAAMQPRVLKWLAFIKQNDYSNFYSSHWLDLLFPKDSLVCVARNAYDFGTLDLGQLRTMKTELEYVVPNPMTARFGLAQDGKTQSAHTLANTGEKVYQVIEFDTGVYEEHLAFHLHLSASWPLALVVYSGGKSVHGWFRVDNRPDAAYALFWDACLIGADPKLWSRTQFSRMPNGRNNKTKAKQSVLFYNPKHLLGSVL